MRNFLQMLLLVHVRKYVLRIYGVVADSNVGRLFLPQHQDQHQQHQCYSSNFFFLHGKRGMNTAVIWLVIRRCRMYSMKRLIVCVAAFAPHTIRLFELSCEVLQNSVTTKHVHIYYCIHQDTQKVVAQDSFRLMRYAV